MFKHNIFINWKCLFGHNWVGWVTISSKCVEERFCKWCQTVEQKVKHRYGPWAVEMAKSIVREGNGKQHEYDSHTIQVKVCQDCNYRTWEKY